MSLGWVRSGRGDVTCVIAHFIETASPGFLLAPCPLLPHFLEEKGLIAWEQGPVRLGGGVAWGWFLDLPTLGLRQGLLSLRERGPKHLPVSLEGAGCGEWARLGQLWTPALPGLLVLVSCVLSSQH